MKKIISIFLCMVCILFCCSCNDKINIEDTNVTADLKAKIETISTEYYNKYENKKFDTDLVKKSLYVKVASGLKSAYSVSFGSVSFDNKEKIKFNIGKDSYIYTLAFFKNKDTLMVFAPLLAIEAGTNKTLLFCVDGLYFSVKIYDGEYNKLTLLSVKSIGTDEKGEATKEKNNADRDVVTHTISNIETDLGIKLNVDNTAIKANSILLARKSYQKYSDPTEYLIYVCTDEENSIMLDHTDSKEELQKNETRNIDVSITLFGGGQLGFDLKIKLV